MKRRRLVAAAVATGAACILLYMSSPPARLILRDAPADGTVPGVLHVHTNRSDGRSSPDDVAAAAAAAGLQFVVFTDHGDGTRPPDPPAYRSGVLCLDGVEISTSAGHYVALGMPAAPYPLGGEPRDVVEDVRRLGGYGIAAHPDSPKTELRWGDWRAPIDALEIVNLDTGWRVRARERGILPKLQLLGAFGTYPFLPGETIASLIGDRSGLVERWQSLIEQRAVVGVAGVDAHAKLTLWDVDPGDNRFALPFPGYEAIFRTLSVHVRPDRPLSGDAAADGEAILKAIRAGHVYTAIDAIATPASFEFSASSHDTMVRQGGSLTADEPVRLSVRSNAPREFTTTIWEGGRVLTTGPGASELTMLAPPGPAAYRVEIRASNRTGEPVWIISNPIYVGVAPRAAEPDEGRGQPGLASSRSGVSATLFPAQPFGWTVEHDPASRGDLEVEGGEMRLRFALGTDVASRPRVAIAAPPTSLVSSDQVTLRMRADRPMRVSVQLRTGVDGTREERWQRSVYVDSVARDILVPFGEMRPVGEARGEAPPLGEMPSLVLVVDTTNTKPGTSGTLSITGVAFAR